MKKTKQFLKDELIEKIRLNTQNTQRELIGTTKSFNDNKKESILQTNKNLTINSNSIIKEEHNQINKLKVFAVNCNQTQNINSQNSNQNNNLNAFNNNSSNLNLTNNLTINNNNVNKINNNSFNTLEENKMLIDDYCENTNPNINNNNNNNKTCNNITINKQIQQIKNTFSSLIPNPNNHIIQVKSYTNLNTNSNSSQKNLSSNLYSSSIENENENEKEKKINITKNHKISNNILKPEEMITGNPNIYNPNPQLVDEYLDDIFQHLKEIEFNIITNPLYMKSQTDINEKMRAILIDWLVEVHLKFKLLPETLFLTVNLIDRYLNKRIIMRNRLQLVGVTAMLIACKYEEIYPPEVKDFVYFTDKAYTKEEIFQMENDILLALEFNITVPSSFRYMEIFNRYLKLEENAIMFCRYLLELFLVEYKMIKYNPSLLAASTMYITLKITKKNDAQKFTELIGYTDLVLKECSKDICQILDNVEKNSLQAIRNKFSLPRFMEVAKIKFN